jgi:hypothetical protein
MKVIDKRPAHRSARPTPPRMPTEDGTTNLGQSSPAKPDLVHVEPMSMTIAETSSEEGERRNAA